MPTSIVLEANRVDEGEAVKRIALSAVSLSVITVCSAQISSSAYRALGQADLRQNGINRVQGIEMYTPSGLALDTRDGTVHIYIADSRNNRILCWADVRSYQTGDAPSIVLGQPSAHGTQPLGIGIKGLVAPLGIAVDPTSGNLYVADFGDNRVVRFANPFAHQNRVEPDAVYGQPGFSSRGSNAGGLARSSLNGPRAVAFDSAANLWIADTGNHRVLRYNASALDALSPSADIVLGQKDMVSGGSNRSGGGVSAASFDSPAGLIFDQQGNLYVADFANARVLRFNAPITMDESASTVYGQTSFANRGAPAQPSNTSLAGPIGLAVDNSRNLYVAVPADNRVMIFPSDAANGTAAKDSLGQPDFSSNIANATSTPLASSRSLSGITDVKVDPDGKVYAADSGNNRVVMFARGEKSASRLWGQADYSANGINQIKPTSINAPYKMAIDYSQAPYVLYVSDTNNHRVLVWRDAARFRNGDPADLVIGQPDFGTAIPNIDSRSQTKPTTVSLSGPRGLALDMAGNLWVADSNNNRVLRYPRPVDQTGRITPDIVLGQPDFSSADSAAVNPFSLAAPAGVAIGPDGNIFVADSGNNRVLEFAAGSGIRSGAVRVYGQPSFSANSPSVPPSSQTLSGPQGVYVDPFFALYIADSGNNRVLIYANTQSMPSTGAAATIGLGQDGFDTSLSGTGAKRLRTPIDVNSDSQGNIYVSDAGNNRVVQFPSFLFVPTLGGAATAVIGQQDLSGSNPNWNAPDGLATAEGLYGPLGIFVDRRDTLYVGDAGNNRVVHFLRPAIVFHPAYTQTGVPLGRGAVATITGSGLSENQATAASGTLPNTLAGRQVLFNDDLAAPLSEFTASKVSLQVPLAVPIGNSRVVVRVADTGELIAGTAAAILDSSPGLFAGGDQNSTRAVLNQDGTANTTASPALRGSTIKIFGTGQGPVSPPVPDGEAAPNDSISTIAVPTSDGMTCLTHQPSVCVAMGSTFGDVQFSGLAPGMIGIWQLSVKIPSDALTGNVPVRAVINGVPSNIITVAIR